MTNSPRDLRQPLKELYQDIERLGCEALKRLPELYSVDICSYTPTDDRFGLEKFTESWVQMIQQFPGVAFTDISIIGDADSFAFCQTMTILMGIGDPARVPIVTVFHVNTDGLVFLQRDYWDTAAALAQVSPLFESAYRTAVGALLGGGKFDDGNAHLPTGAEDGCYHPQSEKDLVSLVRRSTVDRATLRVVGSAHSVWESIVPTGFTRDPSPVARLMLDEYRRVLRFFPNPKNSSEMLVEVQAGCNLGYAPRLARACPISPTAFGDDATPNVSREASWEQSLCFAMQQRGYALPDLGGISHQTVGGFLSTGSAGGTCKWSFSDSVHAIRIVDGNGQAKTLSDDGPNREAFAAAGVGLGLCGILSTVTLKCEPTYNIVGRQTTSRTRRTLTSTATGTTDRA
jgi:FAD binding domain